MAEPGEVVARSARALLRRPAPADREAFSRLVVASRSFLAPWANGAPVERDPDGLRWFEATLRANESGRNLKLFVCRRRDGALMGAFNFNEIVRGALQGAYLGYWIGAPFARQGYMGEALAVGLAHAFGPLALHRVEANIQPGNVASLALVRSAGFRREGFSPRYLHLDGAWRDHERWAMTVEDWRALQERPA
jgi:ribosomal-protein-alanine N-acetyltransferase